MENSVEVIQSFQQIQVAAAFAVDKAVLRKITDCFQHRAVGGQLFRIQFRITAAEINPVQIFRQDVVAQRRERHDFHAVPPQKFEIFLVIEAEGFVHCDTQPKVRRRNLHRSGDRTRRTGNFQKPVHGKVLFHLIRKRVEPFRFQMSDGQPQMPLRKFPAFVSRERSEERRQLRPLEGFAQQVRVPGRADVVCDHSRNAHLRMPFGKAFHQRRDRTRNPVCVHRQDHGQTQQRGNLGGRAPDRSRNGAVKQSHDALRHGGVRIVRVTGVTFMGVEIDVQVDGRAARRLPVEQRVDVIRPAFERSRGPTAPRQRAENSQREGRLPAPGMGSGDHELRKIIVRHRISPGSRADRTFSRG
ncbi:MAG: hypothetical protein BWY31_03282 [Lentisphaerae bacterium ADurb.Bin242]|nr:MAG: hypothetical protein BWY31_03282 [Lentisphaerae bacterium ADurb.Bin242]